jgi:hypothetical protein
LYNRPEAAEVPSGLSPTPLIIIIIIIIIIIPLDLSRMGDPISSYATAGIALRVSGALKPHHHDNVETSSVRT